PCAAGRWRQVPRFPGQAHERLSSLDFVRHRIEHVDKRSSETISKGSLFETRVELILRRSQSRPKPVDHFGVGAAGVLAEIHEPAAGSVVDAEELVDRRIGDVPRNGKFRHGGTLGWAPRANKNPRTSRGFGFADR